MTDRMRSSHEDYTPLHALQPGPVHTAGRLLQASQGWRLADARRSLRLSPAEGVDCADWRDGALARVHGRLDRRALIAEQVEVVHLPEGRTQQPNPVELGRTLRARARLNARIRAFFDERDFLEVETPFWVEAPGTDPHLDPVPALYRASADADRSDQIRTGYLHTSPEFAMKRLLSGGADRIFELCKVWRNGEVTERHNPEFTILEWYRAWEPVESIMADVEELTRGVILCESRRDVRVPGTQREVEITPAFRRITMQEAFAEACDGLDVLQSFEADALLAAAQERGLLRHRLPGESRWDEIFFELMVERVDPYLAELGAVFVTHWPAPLAVLARKDPEDPRVALRFELYVGGLELANGFEELTDPVEQRARFEEDLEQRRAMGLPSLPMPERFLAALEAGMPPAAGVAMGVDRLLMLTSGADEIAEVLPFAMRRGEDGVRWG